MKSCSKCKEYAKEERMEEKLSPGIHKKVKKMEKKKKSSSKKDPKKPKNFIAGAIKKPGALRKELHVKKGHKIPKAKLEKASHAKGKEGQRARFALTLAKLRKKK